MGSTEIKSIEEFLNGLLLDNRVFVGKKEIEGRE